MKSRLLRGLEPLSLAQSLVENAMAGSGEDADSDDPINLVTNRRLDIVYAIQGVETAYSCRLDAWTSGSHVDPEVVVSLSSAVATTLTRTVPTVKRRHRGRTLDFMRRIGNVAIHRAAVEVGDIPRDLPVPKARRARGP